MSDTSNHASHEHGDDHAHAEDGEVHAHVGSYRQYLTIFFALIFFTLLTVGIARVHLGPANLAVAVVVASIKAVLVCVFFMHLKDDNRFNSLVLVVSLLFIGVFFAYTTNDTGHRAMLDTQAGAKFSLATGEVAPGGYVAPKAPEHHAGTAAEPSHKDGAGDGGHPDKGAGPAPVGSQDATAEAKALFASRCVTCHGASGHGDGAAAAAMNPKPRSFADKDWQKSKSDDQLALVIVKGGAAAGLSPLMVANADLEGKPEIVKGLVALVRSAAK
jgi:cytochrome c oxidase subunit 4